MKKTDFVSKTGPVYPIADPNNSHEDIFEKACKLYDEQIQPLFFKLRQQPLGNPADEKLASLEKTVQTLRITYGDAYFKVTHPGLDINESGNTDYYKCFTYIINFNDDFESLLDTLHADHNASNDLSNLKSIFTKMCDCFVLSYLRAKNPVQELSDDFIQ